MTDNGPPELTKSMSTARRRRFTTCQTGLLISLLVFTLLILAGGLGLVSFQEGYWNSKASILTPLQHNTTLISSTVMVLSIAPHLDFDCINPQPGANPSG